MEFKYLVIAILVLILISLGKALFHLSNSKPGEQRQDGQSAGLGESALSVLLFVLLLVAYSRGWIEPQRSLPLGRRDAPLLRRVRANRRK